MQPLFGLIIFFIEYVLVTGFYGDACFCGFKDALNKYGTIGRYSDCMDEVYGKYKYLLYGKLVYFSAILLSITILETRK